MKKIPTVFERDWDGDRSRVTDQVHPGCEWVLAGEGVATRKLDGTATMIRDGKLYKRHEVRQGKQTPEGFEQVEDDLGTGKTVGWVPVGDGPEDRWHREAFALMSREDVRDGTYELIGPKIQGNPEKSLDHTLVPHGPERLTLADDPPRTFDGLAAWLSEHDVEGIVWHHPDGRMAKIKGRDFGIKRES